MLPVFGLTVSEPAPALANLREEVLEQGVLAEGVGEPVFTQDCVPKSPSAAARRVLGQEANGRTARVDAD